MNLKNSLIAAGILGTMLFVTSCNKELDTVPAQIVTMDDLRVPATFNWQTTREVTLHVMMPKTIDFTLFRSRIDILSGPESQGGVMLNTGSVDATGLYSAKLRVPTALTQLYVKSDVGSAFVDISSLKSSAGLLDGNLDFGSGYDSIPPPGKTATVSKQSGLICHISGQPVTQNLLDQNLIQNGTFDVNSFGKISDWPSPMTPDGKWYYTNTLTNAVSQYNEAGNKVLRINVPTTTSYRSGGVAQLISANPGQLITFSADFKLLGTTNGSNQAWMYIIPRDETGASITYYNYTIHPISSSQKWNRYTVAATMPAGTKTVQILLWQWVFSGSFLWDNIVVTGPVADGDGDGVNDESDEYPEDPLRAFNIYYPEKNAFSTIAFEDNWPGRGDYDFNDLVVDYRYQQVTNGSNALVELYGNFSIRAIGAYFNNGFGFQMDLDPQKISSITGTSVTKDYISLLSNNAEAGQTKGTIIITDDVFVQLPFSGTGIGVNTVPDMPYVQPVMMNVKVSLSQPVSLALTGTPPYNPFLIVNQERGREIHLPNQPPTALADQSLFGSGDDNSIPESGRYYKTKNNLPWALEIPYEFEYPIEKALVINAYLHFAEWAQSGGTQYPDWYLPTAGYRDNSLIYQAPSK
jgi:LruC domain-containing protein